MDVWTNLVESEISVILNWIKFGVHCEANIFFQVNQYPSRKFSNLPSLTERYGA